MVLALNLTCGRAEGAGEGADRAAILAILKDASADMPNAHVAADLDWENAFGIRYTDLQKRDAFYGEVVTPLKKNSTDTTLETKVRFLSPDIAVADEYWHVVGQLDVATHKVGPDRWGRTTYVFQRRGGHWTDVLERVADLRYPYYRHYDALPKAAPVPPATLARYAGLYRFTDDHAMRTVSVAGDHLTVMSPKKTRVGIPVSERDFLLFDPDDLAQYSRLHFADGGVLTLSDEVGDKVGALERVR